MNDHVMHEQMGGTTFRERGAYQFLGGFIEMTDMLSRRIGTESIHDLAESGPRLGAVRKYQDRGVAAFVVRFSPLPIEIQQRITEGFH